MQVANTLDAAPYGLRGCWAGMLVESYRIHLRTSPELFRRVDEFQAAVCIGALGQGHGVGREENFDGGLALSSQT